MNFQPRLIREAQTSGWLFPLAVITAFIAGGLSIFQSFQLSRIISGVFLEAKNLAQVAPVVRLILAVVLVRAIFTFLTELFAGRLAVTIKTRLRKILLQKIDRLGPEILKNESSAELTTTALQGVDALDAYFSQYLPQVLIAVLLPLTILVVVFPLDLLTGIVFLVTAPLIPLFMVLIGKAVENLTGKQWQALTRLGKYFLDTLQGISTLKQLGRNKDRADAIRKTSEQYRDATLSVLRVTFLTALVLELIATISTAIVAVEIGLRLLYSRIEFQQAFFILLIAPEFYLPLRNLSARYHAGITGVSAAQKIYGLLDTPEAQSRNIEKQNNLETEFKGDFTLSVQNLSHLYIGRQTSALNKVTFEMVNGRHYVLVGKSGAGKSTLARALLRFIEPVGGEILINDRNICNWTREDWHSQVGWLPQFPMIFNATLLQNLTLGNSSFSDDNILRALKAVNLIQLVDQLPAGLETPLLEAGQRFSGGELQRVALARIFLRDPRLLIMDEPTAHLDPSGQKLLDESIQRLMAGRTTLTIAHRLSSVKSADEVLFLDSGRLAAQGRHEELLITSANYRDFIEARGEER